MTEIHNPSAKDSHIEVDKAASAAQPSNLWHDAYEHRGEIAAAVSGAVGVAAAIAINHTGLGRALGLARDVLVIEDTALFSHCIKRSLTSQGEKVTILKGVDSLKPFVGILEDGSKQRINLNKIKAAFVDGNLQGTLHGVDVIPALHNKNVFAIAMSSEIDVNKSMIALGANLGEQKPVIMQALREGDLSVGKSMNSPFKTQAELENKRIHFNDDAESVRRKKMEKEMMTEFLEEEEKAEAAKKSGALAEHHP